MFSVSTTLHLLSVYSLAAWLCSSLGVFILATMIPPKWSRVVKATGVAMLFGGFLLTNPMLWLPDCESADWFTWFAMGCPFLS